MKYREGIEAAHLASDQLEQLSQISRKENNEAEPGGKFRMNPKVV
jgi:hypothetical protein